MSAHVFVYGTLMRPFQNYFAQHLRAHAEFKGIGFINGSLFCQIHADFWYPVAFLDEAANTAIRGELYRIKGEAAALLQKLDSYEGVDSKLLEGDEYCRKLHHVELEGTGQTVEAWVYLAKARPMLPGINSGDFLKYLWRHNIGPW